MKSSARRWWPGAAFVTAAVVVGVRLAGDGHPVVALACALALCAVAWWVSPLRGRASTRDAEGRGGPDDSRAVVVYWRPGCVYSERLRARLRRTRWVTWVNIWEGPAAAAFVRRHNDGDEVVPTVVIGSRVWTNPDPKDVRRAVRRAALSAR